MSIIKQLDPHVADLIAAGEVVERPASVVKELMENAIDAGASAITVEISHGGMIFIRVTDNGCGIPSGQAATAFLRHATSKISNEYDLEAIGTLGFRGEALAAIAAVSRVEMITRTGEEPLGTALSLEGGRLVGQEETGAPKGTTMVVRDLFYNTPARLKFTKKDAAEGASVFASVQRIALSHPELSVKFIRDGRQELLTPGDGQLKSAVYAVMGRDIASGLLPVEGSGEGMRVAGFASMPACCRGSRSYQHYFVNGRYVKSSVMTAALEEAYKNQRMVGRFPSCVLHLTVRPHEVDVNVHPAKTEVKFQREQQVFSTIYYAVLSGLNGEQARPQAVFSPVRQELETGGGRVAAPIRDSLREHRSPPPEAKAPHSFRWVTPLEGTAEDGARQVLLPVDTPKPAEVPPASTPRGDAVTGLQREGIPDTPPAPESRVEPAPWQVKGELFRTYVLVEQGDRILLIDKHAAHERVNFDRLKAADYQPMVQELLTPVTFTLAPEDRAALLEQEELLARFGFEVEEFGGAALAVRAAPDYLDGGELEGVLSELAQRIRVTGTADPAAARDELLHTMACKAAIKGGQRNGGGELEEVARMVLSGQVKYCPHGRPVAIELTRKQLEKQFKRT